MALDLCLVCLYFLSEIQLELKSGACMASCWHVSECLVDSRVRLWLCMCALCCMLAVLCALCWLCCAVCSVLCAGCAVCCVLCQAVAVPRAGKEDALTTPPLNGCTDVCLGFVLFVFESLCRSQWMQRLFCPGLIVVSTIFVTNSIRLNIFPSSITLKIPKEYIVPSP